MSSPSSANDSVSISAIANTSESVISNVELSPASNIVDTTIGDVVISVEDTVAEVEDMEEVLETQVKETVTAAISNAVEQVIENDILQEVAENVALEVVDEVFDELVEKFNVKVGDLEINAQTIMTLTRYAMEVVELSELKGSAQKEMVLRLLTRVIKDAPISDEQEALCLRLLEEGVVSSTIDIIVDATHGNIDVNRVVDNAVEVAVSTGCCGLLGRFTQKK